MGLNFRLLAEYGKIEVTWSLLEEVFMTADKNRVQR